MNKKYWIASALCLGLLPGLSQARDTTHYLPFDAAVQEATNAGRLDGSVKFYLGNTPAGAKVVRASVTTSKKTNAFNKTDEAACSWALQSALIHLQNAAKQAGANAVTNLVSNYQHKVYSDRQKFECHAGAVMAGVALKGDLAKVR
ncbi:excinuclease [Pseudomonas sp. ABC1]|uniref:excinuclease n=1 Tax=Pseudomonas sp. ABC1 TaxID=2748080 RepID=UPI0015C36FAC|nr:excinuclease [Pseudomonas sp. ABC1]QLF94288.1 excinuclease [Pseudomonas sp. ABC1]